MISICRSAATLSAALPSWCRPIRALTTVRPRTTNPVETSCRATMLTTAAPTSTSCMRSRYWRRNACQPGSLASSASLFGPYRCRRSTTSAALRPAAGSTSSRRQTSSAESPYQSASVSGVTLVLATALMTRLPGEWYGGSAPCTVAPSPASGPLRPARSDREVRPHVHLGSAVVSRGTAAPLPVQRGLNLVSSRSSRYGRCGSRDSARHVDGPLVIGRCIARGAAIGARRSNTGRRASLM